MHAYATDVNRAKLILAMGVGSVGIAYLIYWVIRSTGIPLPWWAALPGPLPVAAVVLWLYDRFLWKWRLFSRIPDLSGTWVGTVESDYNGRSARQSGELRISQRWTQIHVQYRPSPASSVSESTMASLNLNGGSGPVLRYEYESDPSPLSGSALSPHRGTARLRLEPDGQLRGDYYTGRGRKTVGEMSFRR